LSTWSIDAGAFPKRLYTEFDHKILEGPTAAYLRHNKVVLRGSPNGCQKQNGLVERAWQTITNMGRAFITDMQMPCQYWYWALCQSVQVLNYIPCTVEGISTTPHELVYGVKPDLRILFRMFSVGFFRHLRDGNHHCSGVAESKSMQGITLGRCCKSDGMIFYCLHTKQLYTSSDYKLDEGKNTPNTFNLQYDGGIFVGLYNPSSPTSACEPFPEGTQISYPLKTSNHSNTILMHGTVISVPIYNAITQLPLNDSDAPPYVIRLIDRSTHKVSPDILAYMVKSSPNSDNKLRFLSWLGNGQKVMYLNEGTYIKGIMVWDSNALMWRFSQHQRNGTELFGVSLSNFSQSFQQYIDDGTLIPGWHKGANFTLAGSAQHVSVTSLQCHLPPGSLTKALCSKNVDRLTWPASYKEEYDGLISNDTFEIISEEEYKVLQSKHGIKAIPSMCISTVKQTNGVPTSAKSRIVALGNFDHHPWTKSNCFSPVVSIPVVCFLTALSVHNKRTLKQGDSKFAFIQANLPDDEITVVKPPVGYPFSGPQIYLALYVDDFLYFSLDDEVEHYFQNALSQKLKVDFLGEAEWFLGMKFDWTRQQDGNAICRISQEGYVTTIANELGLSSANKNPLMTPFQSGLPINTIPKVDMSPAERAPLIAKMQSWLGMINWLQMCTRPDLATILPS
jgi:hypothetical protein